MKRRKVWHEIHIVPCRCPYWISQLHISDRASLIYNSVRVNQETNPMRTSGCSVQIYRQEIQGKLVVIRFLWKKKDGTLVTDRELHPFQKQASVTACSCVRTWYTIIAIFFQNYHEVHIQENVKTLSLVDFFFSKLMLPLCVF
jgi:hypothetical protein